MRSRHLTSLCFCSILICLFIMGVSRAAFELEKKVNAEQLEQRQSMEKNLVSMARDLEKLRAEQTNAENRARVHNSGTCVGAINAALPCNNNAKCCHGAQETLS